MEQLAATIVKKHWYDKLPKWLKIILLIISIITMVYWLCFMLYKILCGIRVIGAFIFEKRNYWTFLCCLLILIVGGLLLAQYYFNLNPFGAIIAYFNGLIERLREYLGGLIIGG